MFPLHVYSAVSHLSDLFTDQRHQPDVKQHLHCRGRRLEVYHQHHSEQQKEGKVRYDTPVKLHLWGAVQENQFGPASQRLELPMPGRFSVGKKVSESIKNCWFTTIQPMTVNGVAVEDGIYYSRATL